jgi:hypothetical protein
VCGVVWWSLLLLIDERFSFQIFFLEEYKRIAHRYSGGQVSAILRQVSAGFARLSSAFGLVCATHGQKPALLFWRAGFCCS